MLNKLFLKKLSHELKNPINSELNIVFTISSTSKQQDEGYLTPTRQINNTLIIGCVIFDQNDVLDLIKHTDGIVDIVLADTEKKIPISIDNKNKPHSHETVCYVNTGNISRICFDHYKKSKVMEYKPNDITVNAAWNYISQNLNYCSGKKIAILGAGNIGSKLALKLVECGANVYIYRRNELKGNQISIGLNAIKHPSCLSNITYVDNPINAVHLADVVIGCSSGDPVVDLDVVSAMKKNGLLVDLGKNSFTKDSISLAIKNRIKTYRVDVTAAIESLVYEINRSNEIISSAYGRSKIANFDIVAGGFIGLDGDVVVDNINNPKNVIGIANGCGDIKRKLSKVEQSSLNKMKALIDKNNS